MGEGRAMDVPVTPRVEASGFRCSRFGPSPGSASYGWGEIPNREQTHPLEKRLATCDDVHS